MNTHSRSKSHARIRAELKELTGEDPDELTMFVKTHEAKKATPGRRHCRCNDRLAALPEGMSTDPEARKKIFKEVVGEDTNGYEKTFGLGVKVPRSRTKRCALEEERAKRLKSEEKVENLQKELSETKGELRETRGELRETKADVGRLTNLVESLMRHQGISMEDDDDGNDSGGSDFGFSGDMAKE